jgi:hypothetical protein
MKGSKPIPGRRLGWSKEDLATKPYAKFWNPNVAVVPDYVRDALAQGPVSEELLPPLSAAQDVFFGSNVPLINGFSLVSDGSLRVASDVDMWRVTPAMIDWWFGWHSDSPERYKLWHPQAHVHARWAKAPPDGTQGRARYVGYTSIVDEYLGSTLIRGAISFVPPEAIGVRHESLKDGGDATLVCAQLAVPGSPFTIGRLAHLVRRTSTGSVMRSRFWIGGSHVKGRGVFSNAAAGLGRRLLKASADDGRDLLVHCTQEMAHLATFLPDLYAAFGPEAKR